MLRDYNIIKSSKNWGNLFGIIFRKPKKIIGVF